MLPGAEITGQKPGQALPDVELEHHLMKGGAQYENPNY